MNGFNTPIQGYDGWNINPSYMTPAYMANFRPAYENTGLTPNPFATNYSMWDSAAYLGTRRYGYGDDALAHTGAHMYNLTSGFGDLAASATQHIAIPAAAWYGMHRLTRNNMITSNIGRRLGAGAVMGSTNLLGRGANRLGLGGLARAGAPLAGGLASAAGGVGAFAGSVFLPIMAAQAVSSLSDAAVMDPYVATRRGMDAMRANTVSQFVSGTGQTTSGGFGMSALRAQEISQALTEAGQGDFSLTGNTYNEIADNMMRAGIFQEVGDMDADRIVDGVKKATSVLKLISRVSGDPDILNGVKTLATLKAGGLDDITKMEAAMHRIRQAKGASGVSMDQLLDTIGNQGMVMAQQQGLTGVTGLLASVDAFAGFTNARRAGLISGGQMQALGGAEGMTQNLMSGAYQTMNSPYGRMVMQGGGLFGRSLPNTIAAWGETVADNPLISQGDWFANQGRYKEQYMSQFSPERMMIETLRAQASAMGQDPNNDLVLASIAQSQGLDPQQFRSMVEADRAMQDPRARLRMGESRLAANRADYVTMLEQEGLGLRGIPVAGTVQEAWKQGSRAFLEYAAQSSDPITRTIADVSDWWESTLTSAKGLINEVDQSHLIKQGDTAFEARFVGFSMREGATTRGGMQSQGRRVRSGEQDEIIRRLNSILINGSPEQRAKANEALQALVNGDRQKFLRLYGELDRETKGGLSGSTIDFRQEAHLQDITDLVNQNLLGAETTTTSIDKVETTLGTELSIAMRSKSPADAVDRIISSRSVNDQELLTTLGIDKSDLEGKTDAQKKAFIADKALDWRNRKIEDIEGTDDEQLSQFYNLMQTEGFTRTQIADYLTTSQRTRDSIVEDLNPIFGNANKKFQEHIAAIQANIDKQAKMDNQGSEVRWQNIRDITDGISKLGPATEDNTQATKELTQVMIESINANRSSVSKLFGNEVTIDSIRNRENTVK